MYYEEQTICGVVMFKNAPNGEWQVKPIGNGYF
jgi:hypothetical protein